MEKLPQQQPLQVSVTRVRLATAHQTATILRAFLTLRKSAILFCLTLAMLMSSTFTAKAQANYTTAYINVSGAGDLAANGRYDWYQNFNNAGAYKKNETINGIVYIHIIFYSTIFSKWVLQGSVAGASADLYRNDNYSSVSNGLPGPANTGWTRYLSNTTPPTTSNVLWDYNYYIDADNDGYSPNPALQSGTGNWSTYCAACNPINNGRDCDDNNPNSHAGIIYYQDADGDGYGRSVGVDFCQSTPPAGYVTNNTDCSDGDANIFRLVRFYPDNDHDGYGTGTRVDVCVGSGTTAPYGYSNDNGDCNDNNATMYTSYRFYYDADNDGYGNSTSVLEFACAASPTTPPPYYSLNNTDCSPGDATTNTIVQFYIDADGDGFGTGGLIDRCTRINPLVIPPGFSTNNLDCDDTNATLKARITGYLDADGDGYGSTAIFSFCLATLPSGYVTNNTDCNDNDASKNRTFPFYTDTDGDGFGTGGLVAVCATNATTPPSGYSINNTDCNDANATINRPPTVVATTTNATPCAGSSTQLRGTGATTYTWSGGITDNTPFTPTVNQTYTVTGTTSGCSATATRTITINPLPTVTTTAVNPTFCNSPTTVLHLDGVDDYIYQPITINGNSGTWEAWVQKADWTDHHNDLLFGNGIDAGTTNSFMISLHPGVGFHFRYGGAGQAGNNYVSSLITKGFAPNSWHHLAAAWLWNGTQTALVLYIDGVAVTNDVATLNLALSAPTYLGGDPANPKFGAGSMKEVSLWSIARTAIDIKNTYTTSTAYPQFGLYSLLDFNDGLPNNTNVDRTTDRVNAPSALINFALSGSASNFILQNAPINHYVTLTGGGATSYSWSNGITDNVPFLPVVSNTYIVTATDANGCVATAARAVTVNQAPAVSVAASATSVCIPSTTVLNFDGVDDYIYQPVTINGNSGTWQAWVQKADWADHHNDLLFGNGIDAGSTNSFMISLHPGVGFHFRYGGGGQAGNNYVSSLITKGFAPNSWHHLAATWFWNGTQTSLILLVDGVAVANDNATLNLALSAPTFIGGDAMNPKFGAGSMKDVSLWSVPRTANDIKNTYRSSTAYPQFGLYSLLDFNSGVPNGTNIDRTTDRVNAPSALINFALSGSASNFTNSIVPMIATPITLTASGASSYTWNGGITNATAFGINTTTTYTVTATDANGCIATTAKTVTINAAPTIAITANTASICVPSSTVLNFDGTNDYISQPLAINGSSGTWEAWVQKADWTAHNNDLLFGNGIDAGTNNSFMISLHPGVGFHFRYGGGGQAGNNYVSSLATKSFAANSWHHLAAAWHWNGTQTILVLFIDGVAVANNIATLNLALSAPTYMGGDPVNPKFGAGNMKEISTWNTPRAPNDIATTYAGNTAYPQAGLYSLLTFNSANANGTNANTIIDNANAAVSTLNNFALSGTTSNFTSAIVPISPTVVTLTASGATSYTWSGSITNGAPFAISSPTTYTVTATDTNGCVNTATRVISVVTNYTITASAGSNGSISDAGVTTVCRDGSKTYTITPNSGYHIVSVLVDGASVGAVSTYTFNSITASHTINATFESNCPATFGTFTAAACGSYTWVAKQNKVYTASNTIDTIRLVNYRGCDSIVTLNLTINTSTHNVSTQTTCDTYIWNGTTYTTSGTKTFAYNSSNGCASVDTLKLTINRSTHNVTTQTACDAYTWNGTTYTTSGTKTFAYNSSNGCASVDTLKLTINISTHNVSTQTTCDTYTWNGTTYTTSGTKTFAYNSSNGCPSVDTLKLTINRSTHNVTTQTACDAYTWNGVTYTTSGTKTFTYNNSNGCTGIDSLILTISPNYTITASAGSNGSISNVGTTTLCSNNGSQTYTITANSGFGVDDVLIDGVSVGIVATYTFTNINAPHTIAVTFVCRNLATIKVVTNTNDAGCGSLRQAILDANIDNKQDTIIFSGITYPATIILTSGELSINNNLVILGPGATKLAISGNNSSRVFTVNEATTMNNISIINGITVFGYGGAITNSSSLTQTNCNISNSSATYYYGGAINNIGTLIQTNCTISNSSANQGGGISNFGILTQTNCTVANNFANFGGGIVSVENAVLTQINCTIANNSARFDGDAIGFSNYSSTYNLKNTIINTPVSVGFTNTITSQGNNISSNSSMSSYLTATGDLNNTNPLLGALADNGGPTKTCALLVGSPAINAGNTTGAPLLDQRGRGRTGNIDIGAYEYCTPVYGTFTVSACGSYTWVANNNTVYTANNTTDVVHLTNTGGCDSIVTLNLTISTNFSLPMTYSRKTQIQDAAFSYYNNDCMTLIAKVQPTGASPISGNTTAKVWIETTQPAQYVKRHHEITPANNSTTATATITLYYMQSDFDDFNAVNTAKLPINPSDAAGIANLYIQKIGGRSIEGTGTPGTYTGAVSTINPDDANIVWNSTQNYWEVTFDVAGFSGFFAKSSPTPLPVRLLSFSGKTVDKINLLAWTTATEQNNAGFEVERSRDGATFEIIGFVRGNGNSTSQKDYGFTDNQPFAGINYYRLKQTDFDGKYEYSNTISLKNASTTNGVFVYPNPSSESITIDLSNWNNNYKSGDVSTFELQDLQGRTLLQGSLTEPQTTLNLAHLPKAVYTLRVIENGKGTVEKIVLQ